MNAAPRSHEILKNHFERKKKSNPTFSMRSFAKRVGISPAYASRILSGQKTLPLERVDEFAEALDLDLSSTEQVRRMRLVEQELGNDTMNMIDSMLGRKVGERLPSEDYDLLENKYISLNEEWYYIPMLMLLDHSEFRPTGMWMGNELGLRHDVAERAWERLVRLELVEETDGKWKRNMDRFRTALTKSDPTVRRFHQQMMKKACEELAQKHSKEDFERRLITGVTVSTTPEKIAKARAHLLEALHEASNILAEGEGPDDEVYHLAFQLFPLN